MNLGMELELERIEPTMVMSSLLYRRLVLAVKVNYEQSSWDQALSRRVRARNSYPPTAESREIQRL